MRYKIPDTAGQHVADRSRATNRNIVSDLGYATILLLRSAEYPQHSDSVGAALFPSLGIEIVSFSSDTQDIAPESTPDICICLAESGNGILDTLTEPE